MSDEFAYKRDPKLQERLNREVEKLARLPSNAQCADCQEARRVRFCSVTLGVFLCNRCYGLHRALGAHVTRVKCLGLDAWAPAEVELLTNIGNERANRAYLAALPTELRPPAPQTSDREVATWIRDKYERKRWHATLPSPAAPAAAARAPPPPALDAPAPAAPAAPAAAVAPAAPAAPDLLSFGFPPAAPAPPPQPPPMMDLLSGLDTASSSAMPSAMVWPAAAPVPAATPFGFTQQQAQQQRPALPNQPAWEAVFGEFAPAQQQQQPALPNQPAWEAAFGDVAPAQPQHGAAAQHQQPSRHSKDDIMSLFNAPSAPHAHPWR